MAEHDGTVKIGAMLDDDDLKKELSGLGGYAKKGFGVLASASKVAVGAITAAATATVGVGAACLKMSANFEQGMAKVATIADTSKMSLDDLGTGLLDISSMTGNSAEEMTEALYSTLSAGVETGKSLEFVENSAKLAAAGFTTTESAVDALSTVLNGYKMGAEEASKVSDMLLQTQNKGKTTVDELAASMANVTPIAASMNVGFDQVSASLATMTAQGIPTAQATTQLRQVFAELGKSGTVASENLKKAAEGTEYAGKSFQELMKEGVPLNELLDLMSDYAEKNGLSMSDMFSSIEAGQAALALSGLNSETYTNNLKAMAEAAGLTEKGFETMTDTFEGKSAILSQSAKNLAISLGEGLKESSKGILDFGIDAIEQLKTAFDTNGVEGMIEAGGNIVTGFLTGIANNLPSIVETATDILGSLVTGIMNALPSVGMAALEVITTMIQGMASSAESVAATGVQLLTDLRNGIASALPQLIPLAVDTILNFCMGLLENLPQLVDAGLNMILGLVQGIMNALPSLIEKVPQIINDFCANLDSLLPKILETGVKILIELGKGLIKAIPTIIANAGEIVGAILNVFMHMNLFSVGKDLIGKLGQGIKNMGSSIWDAAKQVARNAIDAIKNMDWLQIGKDVIRGIGSGIAQMGQWLIDQAVGTVKGAFDTVCGWLGINSPSRKARDVIGKNTIAGIGVGYEEEAPELEKKSKKVVQRSMNAMKEAADPKDFVYDMQALTWDDSYDTSRDDDPYSSNDPDDDKPTPIVNQFYVDGELLVEKTSTAAVKKISKDQKGKGRYKR